MASRTRRRPAAALAVAAILLSTLATVVVAAPAEARGRPWPGHPDRRIVVHVVHPGDTATGLAVRYHAWTRELIALNDLGPGATIRVGQRLRVPVVVSAVRRARASTPQPATQPATHPATRPSAQPPSAREARMHAAGWRHWQMSRAEVKALIARAARRADVPVRLAQAVGWQESGWHQPVRSSAGAIGVMQVLPATGLWMSWYAGPLNLRDTHDNVTAGVTLLRVLLDETRTTRQAVGAYYQGLGAVRRHGLYRETRHYVANVLAVRDRLSR
jgi:soluble lytic murein transglycosylase-like protein